VSLPKGHKMIRISSQLNGRYKWGYLQRLEIAGMIEKQEMTKFSPTDDQQSYRNTTQSNFDSNL
jgi:hypothetical protein